MKSIGLIGAGNMGSAILQGVLGAGYVKPQQISVYDANEKRLSELAAELPNINLYHSAGETAEQADMVILAVKPNVMKSVIDEILPNIHGKGVISIAAGWTTAMLKNALQGSDAVWMRVMPNMPAMVGEGMTAVCQETTMAEEDFVFARGIFDSIGRTAVLPERMFDGVTAISGSSPAYVFMMIEAMADAGVREGIPRKTAYEMSAQAVLGSALMVLNTADHPAKLKDAVCSPAGTTIEAVASLEQDGFRSAVMNAIRACAQKSSEMSSKHVK